MARIKKKLLGNMQDKIIQVCSPSLIIFFNSVCQSIATHMFVYIFRAQVCSPSLTIFFNSVCQSIATYMFVYIFRAQVCL